MAINVNPAPITMVDLVQDVGERLLNLYIAFDRCVGYGDTSELLSDLLDAVLAQTDYVTDRVITAARLTEQDRLAEVLLNDVRRRLLRLYRHFGGLKADGGRDHGNLLRTLLAEVFNVSITCVTSGGAR